MDYNIPMRVTGALDIASLHNTAQSLTGSGASRQTYQQPYTQPVQQAYTQPVQQAYSQPAQQTYSQPVQQTYSQPVQQVQQAQPSFNPFGQSVQRTGQSPGQSSFGQSVMNFGQSVQSALDNAFQQPNQQTYTPTGQSAPPPRPIGNIQNAISSQGSSPGGTAAYQSQQSQPVQNVQPALGVRPYNVPAPPADSKRLLRGEKWTITSGGTAPKSLKLLTDWDIADPRCDLDISAFLLGDNGKVPGEEWFVFYGQTQSPDGSVRYSKGSSAETYIDLMRVDTRIKRIALAVTIDEAIRDHLHFGMVRKVCMRLTDGGTGKEIARFETDDPGNGMTSLVIGEIYNHNGTWKLNAVGSGVARDLAGFCGMYGVELV